MATNEPGHERIHLEISTYFTKTKPLLTLFEVNVDQDFLNLWYLAVIFLLFILLSSIFLLVWSAT